MALPTRGQFFQSLPALLKKAQLMHYICDTETAKIHEAGKVFYFSKFIDKGGDFPVLTSGDLLYLS